MIWADFFLYCVCVPLLGYVLVSLPLVAMGRSVVLIVASQGRILYKSMGNLHNKSRCGLISLLITLHDYLLSAYSFQKILSDIPSKRQRAWIQIRTDVMLVLIWVKTVCKGYHQSTFVRSLKISSTSWLPKGLDKQSRPRSDCFWRSSLIRVFPVSYSDKHFVNSSQPWWPTFYREKCLKFTTFSKISSSYLPLQIFDKSLWKLYEYYLWFLWLWLFFPGKSHPICWF